MENEMSDEEAQVEIFIPYQCPLCKEVFLSESERREHMKLEHGTEVEGDGADFGCHQCLVKFIDAEALAVHCREEHPQDTESTEGACQLCSEVFPNQTYLKYHMVKYHSQPVEYKCSMCTQHCSSKTDLETHKRVCPKNLFPCDFCKFRFPSRKAVHHHIRSVHRKSDGEAVIRKKYTCLFCGKMFVRRQDMETHQRTHTGDKPFKCKTCGKGFVSNSELHHHMPTHTTVKAFRCQFCGIAYKNISTLTHHRRVKHLNPVKVPCPFPECSYVGPSEKLLKCHIRTAHIEYKSHVCECGKAFSSLSHLYDHRRRKHDPNPKKTYFCSAPGCTKSFRKQFLAERHFRKDHVGGSEDFKCCKCTRTFAHEETLRQHFSTHKGSRFYYCRNCYTVVATEKGIVNHMAQCREDPFEKLLTQLNKRSMIQNDNVSYEIVVDQLEPDPYFDGINTEVKSMLTCEVGDKQEAFSAEDFSRADKCVTEILS